MPKKSSAKKATPVKSESSAVVTEKPSSLPKKAGSEIDEIFAAKKRKKPEKENGQKGIDEMKKKKKKKTGDDKNKVKGSESADKSFRARKKTADGLKIYTEEELGIANQNAGGTSLCPFDCDCCF